MCALNRTLASVAYAARETRPTDICVCQSVPRAEGEHVTGDRSCTQRLKQPRATARKPKRPPSPKRKELRWFSSEEEESELSDDRKPRSASRHRTPYTPRWKSNPSLLQVSSSTQIKVEVKVPETSNKPSETKSRGIADSRSSQRGTCGAAAASSIYEHAGKLG
ncbi:hypothetical protein MTO96_009506 [Rhipicephalus appendiculatus]